MAKRGTTMIRWTGPSHMERIIGEWVWRSGDVQEVPDQFALELLTLPTDAFEAVDEADVKRLLAPGQAPTLPSPGAPGEGKDTYQKDTTQIASGQKTPLAMTDEDEKELEDGDDIR